MRKYKIFLYLGMLNIWTGLMLRIFSVHVVSPALFFSIGGSFKVIFLLIAIKQGRIKAGVELIFLGAGLSVLALGIYIRKTSPDSIIGTVLIFKAIVLKVIFLFLLFRKLRAGRMQSVAIPVRGEE